MHGNVEEWCLDWYGPYADAPQTDPIGRAEGNFRVTRGGSHSTTLEFLRSANRSGTLPDDRSWLIGFRVVQAEMPSTEPLPQTEPRGYLSICQAADGVIHLISSKQHYAFNLAWLNTPPPAPPEPPKLEAKARLSSAYRPAGRPSQDGWRYNGTGVDEAAAVEVLADGGIGIKTGPGQRARWLGDSKKTFHAADGAAHTTEIVIRVTRSTSPSGIRCSNATKNGVQVTVYPPPTSRSSAAALSAASSAKLIGDVSRQLVPGGQNVRMGKGTFGQYFIHDQGGQVGPGMVSLDGRIVLDDRPC